jgi:hypothetical protein
MALQYVVLPLFSEADYNYTISLQGEAYNFRLYYNERAELWFYDLSFEDGTPVVAGEGFVPNYPIALDYTLFPLTGYFWLEPIGAINTEKYKEFPFELSQYYRAFYIFDDGE